MTVDNNEWELFYPGRYDDKDSGVLGEFQAKLDKINKVKGNINIKDVIKGKLTSKNNPSVSWNPFETNYKFTRENMQKQAYMYTDNNPLFSDADYAGKTRLGRQMTFPLLLTLEAMPAMVKNEGIGDYMVVSQHNDIMHYYKPFYEGDTIFTVYTEQHCDDITPMEGSRYRTFAMSGVCKVYNQKGELVSEGASILKESFRRHKDPAKRNPAGAHAWESPDWWQRKPHAYTDKDWDNIRSMWKNEKARGAEPLYWDDVKIGEEVGPSCSSPLVSDIDTDMMFEISRACVDIKKNMLDPEESKKMVKNKYGIYVTPDLLEKKPAPPPPHMEGMEPGAMPEPPKELSNRDGRATIQNAVLGKYAAGMIYKWMGDEGWLQKIGWDIMTSIPGYDLSVIPALPWKLYPAFFDKFPVFDRVPAMRGKTPLWHALEGDVIITRGFVTDKYKEGSEYFADITWWSETYDKHLVQRGFVTVKLPKKK